MHPWKAVSGIGSRRNVRENNRRARDSICEPPATPEQTEKMKRAGLLLSPDDREYTVNLQTRCSKTLRLSRPLCPSFPLTKRATKVLHNLPWTNNYYLTGHEISCRNGTETANLYGTMFRDSTLLRSVMLNQARVILYLALWSSFSCIFLWYFIILTHDAPRSKLHPLPFVNK
jgi:hypothetical protein